ncbi:MAG: permease, partial [Acidimicrobiales bacterium]
MITSTLWLLLELAALFFAVTAAVQLFQRKMGADRVRAWMGGAPLVAALKGIAIGFVTPFCTFTAIPMLVGLRQAQVPPAGYVAFIVAAPVLDPVLFGALTIIVGLEAALIYVVIAFVAALTLAMVAQAVGIDRHLKPIESDARSSCDESATCGVGPTDEWRGAHIEIPAASRAAGSLLRTMGPLLLLGVTISLIIEATVPPEMTQQVTSASPSFAIPIAAALGTPLYVSTAVFVPIADSLQAAGVGIGAIVALTIAGAGANVPEFVILSKLARPRVIAAFFTYVFGVAVV